MKTVFLRVLESEDKAAALLEAVREPERSKGGQRFEVDPRSFANVPRSPFSYWVSERVLNRFNELPPFEAEGRVARQGGVTGDDFRWLRLWMEIASTQGKGRCVPIAKGGKFSPFYADLALQAWWDPSRDTYWAFIGLQHRPSLKPASFDFYFRPGLTWPLRTNGLSLRLLPSGCVFGHKGPAALVDSDDVDELLALVCISNSRVFGLFVSLQLARTELAQSYEVGLIQTTPVPKLTVADREALARLGRRAWTLRRSLDTRTETSHAFTLPALLQVAGTDLAARVATWSEHIRMIQAELVVVMSEIDERCFVLYGIDEADRRAIAGDFGTSCPQGATGNGVIDDEGDDAQEDIDDNESTANVAGLVAELVSWAVGVAFGRFDVRLATGSRQVPVEPEPFDPLPSCSPGMLVGDDGLPFARLPAGYPLAFPETGVLVDDRGHAQDLPTAVRAVFDAVFGEDADRWWRDVAALLDPRSHDLRVWLAGGFFEHHLKRHSKSRRKAPIVWQLGTPSGRYSVWLYAHRLARDSLFQLQNEVVGQKLTHEERKLASLRQNTGSNPSMAERKEIAGQEAFIEELRSMFDEVKRVAPLWNPNLDDGVVITMAPLWRLVPQHKPWQRELKTKWDELVAGKYDWAHFAMRLWPERVIPKCAVDRSLAIAHGVEDVLWSEGADGKWTAVVTPVRPIDELARERSSPAVKAALKRMLDAPNASVSDGSALSTGGR